MLPMPVPPHALLLSRVADGTCGRIAGGVSVGAGLLLVLAACVEPGAHTRRSRGPVAPYPRAIQVVLSLAHGDTYSTCLVLCRTTARSVKHENKYRDALCVIPIRPSAVPARSLHHGARARGRHLHHGAHPIQK